LVGADVSIFTPSMQRMILSNNAVTDIRQDKNSLAFLKGISVVEK
jgi:hypothetical protein